MRKSNIFWGLFFIVAALLMIVSKLGLIGGFSFWSIFLTIFFVAWTVRSMIYKNPTGIIFSLAFLCIIYAEPLGIEAITPWYVLGAAVFFSIGAGFLYHPRRFSRCEYGRAEAVTENVDGGQVTFETSFGESIKYINTDDFQSADLKCSFGSMKVYFDNAVIQNGQAVINIDASFSGVELYLPKEWQLSNQIRTSFGGVDEKNRNQPGNEPIIILNGKVSFAGVEILYV